jgi:putative hydrolase of the HAD superfamily
MIEQEWRFAEAFDVVILSAEVGLVKPDPAIYQLALDQLGVAAEAAVFLDDFRENVDGARQVGLQAIQFRTTEQAISDLEALLAQT